MNLATATMMVLTAVCLQQTPAAGRDGETPYQKVRPPDVGNPELKVGTKVRVTGKYSERIDEELTLYGCEVPFLLRVPSLSRDLRQFVPTRDNLTITGVVISDETYERAIEVEAISKGPDDLKLFMLEVREILADGGHHTERANLLLKLANRVSRCQQRFGDPKLVPLIRRILREGYIALGEPPSPEDLKLHLDFVREAQALLKDSEFTLEFLLDLGNKFPDHDEIKELLYEFKCRRYRGQWVTYEKFKRAEGFIPHGDGWLTHQENHFLNSIETFVSRGKASLLLLRRRTDREYVLLANGGSVETGMTRHEVQASIGFPDRVRRKVLNGKEFDQWVYEDGYYYFYDGTLVIAPK